MKSLFARVFGASLIISFVFMTDRLHKIYITGEAGVGVITKYIIPLTFIMLFVFTFYVFDKIKDSNLQKQKKKSSEN